MLAQGLKVLRRAVSFVSGKAVFGINKIVGAHQAITGHFGDNGCGGNRDRMRVALHERFAAFARKDAKGEAVYEDEIGKGINLKKSLAHCFMRRLQNVDAVNHVGFNAAEADGKGFGPDTHFRSFPLSGRQLFGVPNAVQRKPRRQDDAGRQDRAGQRPASDFVNPGDPHKARTPGELLVPPQISRTCGQCITPIRDGGQKMSCARPTTRRASSGPHCVPSLLSLRLSPIIR